jgi:hypothetical protein
MVFSTETKTSRVKTKMISAADDGYLDDDYED